MPLPMMALLRLKTDMPNEAWPGCCQRHKMENISYIVVIAFSKKPLLENLFLAEVNQILAEVNQILTLRTVSEVC